MTHTALQGRQLNAEIAIEVMGWKLPDSWPMFGEDLLVPPDDDSVLRLCPAYSSSIEAAWQVVERMTTNGEEGWEEWDFVILKDGDARESSQWSARFEFPMMDAKGEQEYLLWEAEAKALTAPLAICLASLAALASMREDPKS